LARKLLKQFASSFAWDTRLKPGVTKKAKDNSLRKKAFNALGSR